MTSLLFLAVIKHFLRVAIVRQFYRHSVATVHLLKMSVHVSVLTHLELVELMDRSLHLFLVQINDFELGRLLQLVNLLLY